MKGAARSLLIAVMIAACASPVPTSPPRQAFVTVTFAGAALPEALLPLREPSLSNCARCHAAIASEHAGSLHRRAFTNAIFQAAYAEETYPSCRHCHAPRWTSPSTATLATAGVDCATCHVRDGYVIGATRRGNSPHRGPLDPTMSEATFCAGCHEFAFPDDIDLGLPHRDELMQSTFAEWTRSDAAAEGRTCQHCHMPRGAHAMSVREDPAFIRSAFQIDTRAERDEQETRVSLTLRATDVGHAVPTGDLFRALVLSVSAAGTTRTSRLGHRFRVEFSGAADRTLPVRSYGADERLPEPGFEIITRRDFVLPAAAEVEIAVDYTLLPEEVAMRHNVDGWQIPLSRQTIQVP